MNIADFAEFKCKATERTLEQEISEKYARYYRDGTRRQIEELAGIFELAIAEYKERTK